MDRIQPLRIMAGHLSDVDVSSSFFIPSLIFFLLYYRSLSLHTDFCSLKPYLQEKNSQAFACLFSVFVA